MNNNILTFKDLLKKLKSENENNISILIGTGFSMGYDEKLSFSSLTSDVKNKIKSKIQSSSLNENEIRLVKFILNEDKLLLEDFILLLDNGESSFKKLHNILCKDWSALDFVDTNL